MGSGKETKVDQEIVDRMKIMLVELKVDADRLKVEAPRPGLLGQGESGTSLKAQLDLASQRISSTLAQLSDALIKFYDGTDRAAREITGADEDAGAWAKVLNEGVSLVSQPLAQNLAKDDRPVALAAPVPFMPVPPGLLQEIQSRVEIIGASGGEGGS